MCKQLPCRWTIAPSFGLFLLLLLLHAPSSFLAVQRRDDGGVVSKVLNSFFCGAWLVVSIAARLRSGTLLLPLLLPFLCFFLLLLVHIIHSTGHACPVLPSPRSISFTLFGLLTSAAKFHISEPGTVRVRRILFMPRLLSLLLLLAALLAAAGAQQEDYARLEMDSPASGSLLRGRVALYRLHVGERLADPLLLTLVSIEGDMDVLLLLSTTGEPLATPETADDVIDLVGSAARSNETSAYPLTAFGDEQVVIATEDIGGTGCRGPPCVVFVIVFAYDSGEFLLTLSSETDGAPLLSSTATVLDGGKEEIGRASCRERV